MGDRAQGYWPKAEQMLSKRTEFTKLGLEKLKICLYKEGKIPARHIF